MKITKRQLRRIIKEERARLLREVATGDPAQLAAILKRDGNRGTITIEEGSAPDELYIMTGAAEGITIKVLRSGR